MSDSKNDKLIAVVRIRGRVNVRSDITETLNRLHLKRVNNCALIKMTPSYAGMLHKCANHSTYGEIDEETLTALLAKHAEGVSAKDMLAGKIDMETINAMMPFGLHPPRHGYRSTKLPINQGGDLGYRGDKINALIKRMI